MILVRDSLATLVMYKTFSDNVIIGDAGPYKGSSETMVDMNNYEFKILIKRFWNGIILYQLLCQWMIRIRMPN